VFPRTSLAAVAVAGLVGVLASASASAQVSPNPVYTPTRPLIADNGFREKADGFSFANYGSESPYANLTAAEMRDLFGDGVCATDPSDTCTLTPQAEAWEQATNTSMGGGHCYGFSVLALEFWKQVQSPSTFGARRTPDLKIQSNEPLQHQLAYEWATQMLDAVWTARITGAPNEQLDRLRQLLTPDAPETYTIAIFSGGAGHAVTPYAVEDRGDGTSAVLIYDNNWPGITRAIIFDTNANTWSYNLGDGSNPAALWQGDVFSQSLLLFPTSPGRGQHPCPFCGFVFESPGATTGRTFTDVFLQGDRADHGHLLLTDEQGRRFGYVGDQLVQEIPDVQAIIPTLDGVKVWQEHPEPIYRVPADRELALTIDGSTLTKPDRTNIVLVGPAFDAVVRGVHLRPDTTESLRVAADGTALTYDATTPQSPVFELANQRGASSHVFSVSRHRVGSGGSFSMAIDHDAQTLQIDAGGPHNARRYDLTVQRITRTASATFEHRAVPIAAGSQATVDYGAWTHAREPIKVTSQSPSGTEHTREVPNQARRPNQT
jgi:hypothetical protein